MQILPAGTWRSGVASLFLALLCLGAAGAEPPAPAASTRVALQVFVRDGCPCCADAKACLDGLQRQRPGLHIVYRPVGTDPAARAELNALSRTHGAWPPGVPAFLAAWRLMSIKEMPGLSIEGRAGGVRLFACQSPVPCA